MYSYYGMLAFKKGDPDAALAAAAVKAGGEYLQPWRHANPMEPSATVAVWNVAGTPHFLMLSG